MVIQVRRTFSIETRDFCLATWEPGSCVDEPFRDYKRMTRERSSDSRWRRGDFDIYIPYSRRLLIWFGFLLAPLWFSVQARSHVYHIRWTIDPIILDPHMIRHGIPRMMWYMWSRHRLRYTIRVAVIYGRNTRHSILIPVRSSRDEWYCIRHAITRSGDVYFERFPNCQNIRFEIRPESCLPLYEESSCDRIRIDNFLTQGWYSFRDACLVRLRSLYIPFSIVERIQWMTVLEYMRYPFRIHDHLWEWHVTPRPGLFDTSRVRGSRGEIYFLSQGEFGSFVEWDEFVLSENHPTLFSRFGVYCLFFHILFRSWHELWWIQFVRVTRERSFVSLR